MNRNLCLIALLTQLLHCLSNKEVAAINGTEDSLIWSLMANYNMLARPDLGVVNVNISFNLESINELDEREQILRLSGFINAYWNDKRLRWNPDDWQGITAISLPADKIWKPDFALLNSAEDMYNEAFYSSYYLVEVDSDGSVSWFPHGALSVRCLLNLTYYPFDTQRCFLRFENWVNQKNLCRINPLTNSVNLDDYVDSGEWDVAETFAEGMEASYSDNTSYSDVYFYLTIRRKTAFYMLNYVFPCAIMSALACMVFVLPAASEEKVSLNITLLLAFVVLLVQLSTSMPRRSDYTPLLSRYLTLVTGTSAFSLVCTIIIIRISHNSTTEVPAWAKRVLISKLGRWLWILPRKSDHDEELMLTQLHATNHTDTPLHDKPDIARSNEIQKAEDILREILGVLTYLNHEQACIRTKKQSHEDWLIIGLVIDRIMFCVYVTVTVVASIVILNQFSP